MRLALFILFPFLFQNALATHLEKVCKEAVAHPPVFSEDFIARKGIVETTEGQILKELGLPIYSLVQHQESIWTLSAFDLIELSLNGDVLNTYAFETTGQLKGRGRSMVKFGNTLVFTRGAFGMMGFDLETRKFTWHNPMTSEGFPSAIAADESNVYVAVSTSHENGFTGVVSIEAKTGKILKKASYDVRRVGVIFPDAKARMHKGNLVLNNGGWIHLITSKQINSEKKFRPKWIAHRVEGDREVNPHYMMLAGEFMIEGDELIGCGLYTAYRNGDFTKASDLFKVNLK